MATTSSSNELEPLERVRTSLSRAQTRARRELIIFGIAFGCGLFLMPILIWMVGNRMLGAYTHGQNFHAGPFALLGDFLVGLFHGSLVFWVVALGPALLLLIVRVLYALIRALPATPAPPRG